MSPLEKHASEICRILNGKNRIAYWAGGCVRDRILGREAKDIDIATDATPDEIQDWFNDTHPVGKAFGVILLNYKNETFEVATFRRDAHYEDGRRPTRVSFCAPKEDAQRRDFTVNGLFYDPIRETVIDYVNGQQDISDRVIRTIGEPTDRFKEDHLRIMRAVRFASVLEFEIESNTFQTIQESAHLLKRISPERIRDELNLIWLHAPRAGDALEQLEKSGILSVVLPEIQATVGQEQPPEYHPEGDVFTHIKIMLNEMDQRDLHLCYGILLHDVAKPVTAKMGVGAHGKPRIRFDGHAQIGAEMAEDILRRLRFSNRDIEAISTIVRNHMRFMHVREMRKAKLRRWMHSDTFDTELELHRLDCLSSHRYLENYDAILETKKALENEPVLPSCWINGHDLIARGIAQGPAIGEWLKKAYDLQLEGAFPDREAQLNWLEDQLDEESGKT